jgi:large conductance mechanosensitive channel
MAVGRGRRAAGGFLSGFRDFILKGNVVELAIAVVIGAAFGKIITSFTEDLLMPAVINPVLGAAGGDWRELTIGNGIRVGSFLGSIVDFLIVALALYLVMRVLTGIIQQARLAPPPPDQKECPFCLTQIPAAATRCSACTSDLVTGRVS